MKAGKISYAGVGVTVGGVLGFLGVLVGWFSYSYPLNGGTATVNLSGTADWTGTAALVAGIAAFAFGGAYVLIQDAKLRRTIGILMAISSAFLLVMSLVGFGRVAEAVGVPASNFTTATAHGPRDLVRRRRHRDGRLTARLSRDAGRGIRGRDRSTTGVGGGRRSLGIARIP